MYNSVFHNLHCTQGENYVIKCAILKIQGIMYKYVTVENILADFLGLNTTVVTSVDTT